MDTKIPNEMKALIRASDPKKVVEVATIPVPKPDKGEVLVRVEVTPINPSDEYFAMGFYGISKELIMKPPVTPGFEGSGVVVSLGPDSPSSLLGQRVSFIANPHGKEKWSGSWAQYMCLDAKGCIPIGDLSFEDACEMFVNPLTILGFLLEVKHRNSKGLVNTAAASNLGRSLVKVCLKNNVEIINVVRRDEQVNLLKSLGAKHVLNQNAPDFFQKLTELTTNLGITVCFDAVSGPLSGKLLSAMPPKSTVFVYGSLDHKLVSDVNPSDLLFFEKKLEGFWLGKSLVYTPTEISKAIGTVLEDLKKGGELFKPKIVKKLKLDECSHYILDHRNHPTEGKAVLLPNAQ